MIQKSLENLADSQSDLTTYSKNANEQSENLLLTFTNIGKNVFPNALKMVNSMSTALGQDTKSSAIQLGKALNDPTVGLTPLSRVGVSFTASQKDQITTMQKAGNIAGAQAVIMKELQREFGGSAEAAGKTLPGQLTILKNNLLDLGAGILEKVIPTVQNFIGSIIKNMPNIEKTVSKVVNVIVPKFQEWMGLIGQIVSELFPNFGKQIDGVKDKTNIFKSVLDDITDVLKFVADHIGIVKGALIALGAIWVIQTSLVAAHNAVLLIHNAQETAGAIKTGILTVAHGAQSVALGIATAAQWLFNVAMDANPIGAIIILIVALIAVVILIATHWKQVSAFLLASWNDIKAGALAVFNGLKDYFTGWLNNVKKTFMSVWNDISGFFTGTFKNFKQIFNGLIEFFTGVFTGNWKKAFQGIRDIVSGIFNEIVLVVKTPINVIIDLINGVIGNINNIIKAAKNIPGVSNLIGNTQIPKIPKLATGGITNGSMLANIGEAGREAVLPLDRNTSWMDALVDKIILASNKTEKNNSTPVKQGDIYDMHDFTIVTNDPEDFLILRKNT